MGMPPVELAARRTPPLCRAGGHFCGPPLRSRLQASIIAQRRCAVSLDAHWQVGASQDLYEDGSKDGGRAAPDDRYLSPRSQMMTQMVALLTLLLSRKAAETAPPEETPAQQLVK